MTAETPEIPEEIVQGLETPVAMRILRSPAAQQIAKEIEAAPEVSTAVAAAPKRRPGRPPGSKNKPKSSVYTPPSKDKTEAEKVADNAKERASTQKDKKEAPDFTEWRDFIGEVVLHWFAVAFVSVAFRGIPEYQRVMSQEDYEDIQLDDDELAAVARPFAHMLTHSSLNNKYGRAIMNSRDSIEATVVLFMWGQRTIRISKKYRHAYEDYQIRMENEQNVTRIPRPDRERDSTQEANTESEVSRPIGLVQPAFGNGFN